MRREGESRGTPEPTFTSVRGSGAADKHTGCVLAGAVPGAPLGSLREVQRGTMLCLASPAHAYVPLWRIVCSSALTANGRSQGAPRAGRIVPSSTHCRRIRHLACRARAHRGPGHKGSTSKVAASSSSQSAGEAWSLEAPTRLGTGAWPSQGTGHLCSPAANPCGQSSSPVPPRKKRNR